MTAQRFFDEDYPNGRRYYWKSTYLRALSDECVDTLIDLAGARPSPLTSIDVWPMGGSIANVTIDQSPVGRQLQYSGSTYGFTSVCDLYPDAKVAVVLLANRTADGAQESLRAMSAKLVELAAPVEPTAPAAVSPSPSSAGAPPPGR